MPIIAASIIGGATLGGAAMGTFGGGGDVKQYSTLTPEQQSIADPLSKYLKKKVGKGATPYTGQMVAPLSNYEQSGLDTLGSYLRGGTPEATKWGQSALKTQLSGQPSTTIDPAATENFFQQSVRAPALKEFNEDIMPQVRENYANNGLFYGTGRERAEQKVQNDLESNLLSTRAGLAYQDEQARRGLAESAASRQLSALPQGIAYGQEPENRISAALGYGNLPRTVEQAKLEAKQNEWLRTQPEYSPLLDTQMSFIDQTQKGMYQEPTTPSILGPMAQLGTAYLLNRMGGAGTTASNNAFTLNPATGQWTSAGSNVLGQY